MNENILKAKMVEQGITTEALADMLGINSTTLYRKMSGSSDFKRAEIQQITVLLKLNSNEMFRIFFAE